jgi:hypothetical protein
VCGLASSIPLLDYAVKVSYSEFEDNGITVDYIPVVIPLRCILPKDFSRIHPLRGLICERYERKRISGEARGRISGELIVSRQIS